MPRKKPNPDIVALKRAVKAVQSSTSKRAARALINYLYDAFIAHPAKETEEFWVKREAAQRQTPARDGEELSKS